MLILVEHHPASTPTTWDQKILMPFSVVSVVYWNLLPEKKNLLPSRNKVFSLWLLLPALPWIVPFLEAGQWTLLKPGHLLFLEHNCERNEIHCSDHFRKVVPRNVLCILTGWCVCFVFSAFSQEEKFRHRVIFGHCFICFICFIVHKTVSLWH